MKKVFGVTLAMVGVLGILFGTAFAAENEYPNGIEGIKAASVPPPGFYYKMYNVYYTADTLTDSSGNDLNVDFDVTTLVNAHRFIWITDYKILGADYGMDAVVPLMNVDLKIGRFGIDDSQFGLGDIFIEPLILSWHTQCYDLSFGQAYGFRAANMTRLIRHRPAKTCGQPCSLWAELIISMKQKHGLPRFSADMKSTVKNGTRTCSPAMIFISNGGSAKASACGNSEWSDIVSGRLRMIITRQEPDRTKTKCMLSDPKFRCSFLRQNCC
ncbi:MAG: transporter [Desulfobacteraceae bacterium]|nr:transporter [Desulfobacteraceae bacterium]